MDFLNPSEHSFDTLSIRLTQNNIPSSTVIKSSQENISLTYTVSLQNVSEGNLALRNQGGSNASIRFDQECESREVPFRYESTEIDNDLMDPSPHESAPGTSQSQTNNLFKKKQILKVSNIDFSNVLHQMNKEDSGADLSNRAKKFMIRGSNSGLFSKNKNSPEITMSSKLMLSKSKDKLKEDSSQSFGENLLLRTNKFYSIKNDKIIEPLPLRKKSVSTKKDLGESKVVGSPSDRKMSTKLPSIKGPLCQGAAMTQRRKAFTTHESVQNCERLLQEKNQQLLVGKTCRIRQNDKKAKMYLQKIIQNRNSVIHYSDKQRHLKENLEDFFC